jgi:hypothetical protein
MNAALVPATRTEIMLTIGDPGRAFALSAIPNRGVGLARTEFIINNFIGIHPMALARYPKLKDAEAVKKIAECIGGEDPKEFFVRRFSEGVGRSRRRSIRDRSSSARVTSKLTNMLSCWVDGNLSHRKKIPCWGSVAPHGTTMKDMQMDLHWSVRRYCVFGGKWV